MSRPARRLEILQFGLTLFGFGYFHQGGGWNQNARFALVRAIVEGGTFFIDSYLVYENRRDADESADLVRYPLRDATFERDGTRYALAWRNRRGDLVPVDSARASGAKLIAIDDAAASGDVAYYAGHFHPNKGPGTAFRAVPAYAVVRGLERLAGLTADHWWVLTINAWLVSVLSVGLVSALGAVLVLRLACALAPVRDAALTAMVFAFGTMMWPHGTLLFEHNVVAVALLAAFYGIERACGPVPTPNARVRARREGIRRSHLWPAWWDRSRRTRLESTKAATTASPRPTVAPRRTTRSTLASCCSRAVE